MKKIIPFNKIVSFKGDVYEISSISLEHEISKYSDIISGIFHVTGEYKISEALLEKEKFKFDIPFDVALAQEYDITTLECDVDDFRYRMIDNRKMNIDIDLYVIGEYAKVDESNKADIEDIIKDADIDSVMDRDNSVDIDSEIEFNKDEKITNKEEDTIKKIEIVHDIVHDKDINVNKKMEDSDIDKTDIKDNVVDIDNINIINNIDIDSNIATDKEEDTKDMDNYVTYRVYRVCEGDTIDNILSKYKISKELLEEYNDISNIKPMDKLIIPGMYE